MQPFRDFVSQPAFLIAWLSLTAVSLVVLIVDLRRNNRALMSLMKFVWLLTVAYSGPVGLGIYFFAGRTQIPRDSLWRKSWRSVSHCYSGCGLGEIIGVLILSGIFAVNANLWVGLTTFVLAYIIGFSLTLGPLVQDGEPLHRAIRDSFWGESTSIVAMEASAITVDLLVAGNAGFHHVIFWSSLLISLTVGLFVAYPVNVALVHFGVKEGMMNPQHAGKQEHHHHHHDK